MNNHNIILNVMLVWMGIIATTAAVLVPLAQIFAYVTARIYSYC